MMTKAVAYVGIECFDLILYQAKILHKLGKRVLILENRENGAFHASIPRPDGMDLSINPVSYRHIDYAEMPLTSLTTDLKSRYDYIFLSCNTIDSNAFNEAIDKMIFATDLFLHNMETADKQFRQCKSNHKSILIRNVIDVDLSPANLFDKQDKSAITYIYFDENDYANAIMCQHYQTMRFTDLSRGMKKYLMKEMQANYPEIHKKYLYRAFRASKRRD